MSGYYISSQLRQLLGQEANYRCGYCLSAEVLSGIPLTIDHIVPVSLGGSNKQENLWLACRSCNEFKGNRIEAEDPQRANMLLFLIHGNKFGMITSVGVMIKSWF